MLGDLLGDALAATGQAGVDELPHVSPRYSCAHDGQHASRWLPQRTISARSGSSAVEYTTASPRRTTPRNRIGCRHAPVRRTCSSQRSRFGSLARAIRLSRVHGSSSGALTGRPS
jgi:hypothetical protein